MRMWREDSRWCSLTGGWKRTEDKSARTLTRDGNGD